MQSNAFDRYINSIQDRVELKMKHGTMIQEKNDIEITPLTAQKNEVFHNGFLQ